MSFTIRDAEPRDRERLLDLFQALNRHEDSVAGNRRCDRAGAEDSLDASEAGVKKTGGSFLVVEADGHAVGLATLTFKEEPVFVRAELRPYAHIADLVVDENYRRRGIGRALMAAAEARAAERGFCRLVIGVLTGNAAAEAAYLRQGFRPLARELIKSIGGAPDERL